jgi:hypothetical protein
MINEELQKAIEVAEESVEGFAEKDSFEMLLAKAVLELKDRLNNERERILEMVKEGLWDVEGIRYHLEQKDKNENSQNMG